MTACSSAVLHFWNDGQIRKLQQLRQWRSDRLRTCKFQAINDAKSGPLIAIRERLISRKSMGGMLTNLNSQVLDREHRPIPGLYAAGRSCRFLGGGGIAGIRSLEGTFLSNCVLNGRRAARHIAIQKEKIMKKSGAALARYALEQIGVTHTFGIPGCTTPNFYDELNASESIQPVLVAHEGGGAFMARRRESDG